MTTQSWIARNLVVISIITILAPCVTLFGISISRLLFYFDGFNANFAASFISLILSITGFLIYIQYLKFPKMVLGFRRKGFWILSSLYFPAWLLPYFLLFDPLVVVRVLRSFDLPTALGILFIFSIFPITHLGLSMVAYFSANSTEQDAAANP